MEERLLGVRRRNLHPSVFLCQQQESHGRDFYHSGYVNVSKQLPRVDILRHCFKLKPPTDFDELLWASSGTACQPESPFSSVQMTGEDDDRPGLAQEAQGKREGRGRFWLCYFISQLRICKTAHELHHYVIPRQEIKMGNSIQGLSNPSLQHMVGRLPHTLGSLENSSFSKLQSESSIRSSRLLISFF